MALRRGLEGNARIVLPIVATLGLAFFALPLVGLVARAPLGGMAQQLAAPAVRDALWLSLITATSAMTIALAIGFPIAWVLARVEFPGRSVMRALVTLPMVLPPVVAGAALLTAFGRRGLFGPVLEGLGIELPFSLAGTIVAATFVSAPFLIVTVEAALSSADRTLEDAAATLGASRWRILATVVLPGIRPALFAALALTWARALGEFGATITFAGNMQGRTQTMPLAVYETLQSNPDGALLLSLILLALSLLILIALRGRLASR
jgi:molybdate transport system permease protein